MGLLNEFSIQLYTLREFMASDYAGVLRKIGKMGYTGVEFAGYGGLSAHEMKALLDECGLKSIGSHVGADVLTKRLDEEIEYSKTIGTEYIILPWYDPTHDRDGMKKMAETFAPIAEKIKAAGMKFAYHNHSWEFEKDGDTYLHDIFYENSDSSTVSMELDLYWVAYADVDPLSYMKKNNGRVKLLHIKQIKDFASKQCVDLDKGVIDYREIITVGKEIGVEHFILEQEEFDGEPFASVQNNVNYIYSL